jgi:hypothetical protein
MIEITWIRQFIGFLVRKRFPADNQSPAESWTILGFAILMMLDGAFGQELYE